MNVARWCMKSQHVPGHLAATALRNSVVLCTVSGDCVWAVSIHTIRNNVVTLHHTGHRFAGSTYFSEKRHRVMCTLGPL